MCSDIKEPFAHISKNVRNKNLTRNTQQAQCIRRITPGKPDHDQHGRATGPEPGTWHPYGWPGSGGTVTCHQQPHPGPRPTDLRRLQRVPRHEKL